MLVWCNGVAISYVIAKNTPKIDVFGVFSSVKTKK